MEQLNWKSLRLVTSYVTPELFRKYVDENILPVFIARNIANSSLIGGWQGTAVHIPELAPSPELLRSWKYQGMSVENFTKEFFQELCRVDIKKILERIDMMRSLCRSELVVMLGYGENPEKDHRSVVARYINSLGILDTLVKEI